MTPTIIGFTDIFNTEFLFSDPLTGTDPTGTFASPYTAIAADVHRWTRSGSNDALNRVSAGWHAGTDGVSLVGHALGSGATPLTVDTSGLTASDILIAWVFSLSGGATASGWTADSLGQATVLHTLTPAASVTFFGLDEMHALVLGFTAPRTDLTLSSQNGDVYPTDPAPGIIHCPDIGALTGADETISQGTLGDTDEFWSMVSVEFTPAATHARWGSIGWS